MTTYIEYGVTLSPNQKSKLMSAIKNKSPLTLRLKNSHLRGSDELNIADKNACLLINCKILVTRATEKQTLLLAGYKHATIA